MCYGSCYGDDLKFPDKYVWTNSAGPDLAVPVGPSLFAIPFALHVFGGITSKFELRVYIHV